MKSLHDPASRTELLTRANSLSPSSASRWGHLTAPAMLCHITDSLRMATGELPTRSKNSVLRHWPLKYLIVYLMPFPKGAPTAPELRARAPGEWDAEQANFSSAIERFAARDRGLPLPEHPAFGTLSARAWGVLGYRHLDHHLRQFGV